MRILNKEILMEATIEYLNLNNDEGHMKVEGDLNYLHDLCLEITINGLNPEENSVMYGEMVSILNTDGMEIANIVDEFIDDNMNSYYGDPAFSSAEDYWNYILG